MACYLKKAAKSTEASAAEVRQVVKDILGEIKRRGESAVREFSERFDHRRGDFVLSEEKKKKLMTNVPDSVKEDLQFVHQQVRNFAQQQLESLKEFETEIYPGVILGQKLIACNCAGCYVPGGRFIHVTSAIMGIATAKAAGVPFVVACSPPHGSSIHPAVVYAMDLSDANVIMELGGVQAIATMAYGLFTGKPVDILIGPGNVYVTEAKRMLYGQVGIDVFAGPTEVAIIADHRADPLAVAIDLVSQAEHGYDSPAWLITDSQELGEKVLEYMPKLIHDLPHPEAAATSWKDYGEIILCENREEMAKVSDRYAGEHVQVMAEDLDWWAKNLKNYGSLFLGEPCTVCYGDKASGTNHILPTNKASRYTGGLSVHKFIKILTYQRMNREANRKIGAVASRISRLEGMEGHARAADHRLIKYFPEENWDFEVYEKKDH